MTSDFRGTLPGDGCAACASFIDLSILPLANFRARQGRLYSVKELA